MALSCLAHCRTEAYHIVCHAYKQIAAACKCSACSLSVYTLNSPQWHVLYTANSMNAAGSECISWNSRSQSQAAMSNTHASGGFCHVYAPKMCIECADSKIGTAWGVAAAVVGPSIALGTWFLLTWNYRSEKKIITDEVMKRLKVSDICAVDSALQYAPAGVSSTGQAKQAKKIGAFHSAELELQALRNPAKRSSLDDVIGSGSFTSAVSASSDAPPQVTSIFRSGGHASYGEPSPETKKTAREITRRCLRRWDGLLGIRASSDSLGNRAGIWRDRFDTVRCAVLLLAFRKLNQALQGDPSSFRADCPGKLATTVCLCKLTCAQHVHTMTPRTLHAFCRQQRQGFFAVHGIWLGF